MSFQLSAPLNTAAIAISSISSSRCSRFLSTRGSRNSAKYFRGFSISPFHTLTSPLHIASYMRRPWVGENASCYIPATRFTYQRRTEVCVYCACGCMQCAVRAHSGTCSFWLVACTLRGTNTGKNLPLTAGPSQRYSVRIGHTTAMRTYRAACFQAHRALQSKNLLPSAAIRAHLSAIQQNRSYSGSACCLRLGVPHPYGGNKFY